jgi:hypothetical protein
VENPVEKFNPVIVKKPSSYRNKKDLFAIAHAKNEKDGKR